MFEDWLTCDMSIVVWNDVSFVSCEVFLVVWYIAVLLLIAISSVALTGTFALLKIIMNNNIYVKLYKFFFTFFINIANNKNSRDNKIS